MDTKRVIPTTRKAGWKALEIILVFCMDIHIISNKDENNKNCKYVASSLCLDHFFQGTKSYSKLCDE